MTSACDNIEHNSEDLTILLRNRIHWQSIVTISDFGKFPAVRTRSVSVGSHVYPEWRQALLTAFQDG